MDTTVVTLRLPFELVEWIDSVGKRGAVVAEALESMRSPKRVALTDSNMDLIRAAVRETVEQLERGPVAQLAERGTHNAKVAGSNPAGPTINMDALRSICAGNVPRQVDPEPAEDCTPECCECGHKLTGKVVKGVVVAWACPDLGCAMYGLEQR